MANKPSRVNWRTVSPETSAADPLGTFAAGVSAQVALDAIRHAEHLVLAATQARIIIEAQAIAALDAADWSDRKIAGALNRHHSSISIQRGPSDPSVATDTTDGVRDLVTKTWTQFSDRIGP